MTTQYSKKINIIPNDLCYICNVNNSIQKCIECNKHMCLDVMCIDYDNNKKCYECYRKNQDIFEQEQINQGYLVKCDNCEFVWDGNAQCPCGGDPNWNYDISDSEEEENEEVLNGIHIIEDENEPPKKKNKY
jgi:hypothetical protein